MTTKVKTVRLYGKLGQMFGREFKLAVSSPAEAVRALAVQLPGFEAHFMNAHKKGVGFAVFAGDHNLAKEELTHPFAEDEIKIAPVLMGSKQGGWLNIVVGVVLIAVSLIPGVAAFSMPLAIGLMGAGISMALGGVIQLLSPGPKGIGGEDREENRANYNFNGPVNTSAQGNPVPVLYGRMIVGSAVISAGIIAEDDAVYVPSGSGHHGGGGSGGGSPPWHLDWVEQEQ